MGVIRMLSTEDGACEEASAEDTWEPLSEEIMLSVLLTPAGRVLSSWALEELEGMTP